MFMGMIIAIYQFYCVQGRVAIPTSERELLLYYCSKARESNTNC